ncbi:MAG TPA: protein kinase [Vicinamibacteria bacterium]|nr:protein kinase [Vicinamibacteria bacterium]
MAALAPGTRVGPYEILSPLGAGGMGEVYRARDARLGRDVAVKVLPEQLAHDPDRLRRFEQEARAAGALNHPNVLVVYDTGTHAGAPFLVLELLEGETLRERLRGGPLPSPKAVDYAVQIAHGLAAAHERGIVHRDLKPDNIFVTRDGHVKILDFGLAKLAPAAGGVGSDAPTRTSPGAALGTAGYMAPEQVRGEEAGPAADVFALGVVLYEMLAGRRAFERETGVQTLNAILAEEPAPLPSARGVTPALDRLVRHCLEKRPQDRFQSARDLAFDLSNAITTGESVGGRTWPPWTAPVIVLSALLLALAGTLALSRLRAPRIAAGAGGRLRLSTLAVLPFQSLGGDAQTSFLSLALPDEIVTALSHVPELAVRPFATTRKYSAADVDPPAVGRSLGVDGIVAGHYLREGGQLRVTLELIDTDKNSVLWRDSVTSGAQDLIALQQQISTRLEQGLLPVLGARAASVEPSRPKNAEAYDLFLRSAALSTDVAPTREAIPMLERSVALDPAYAPSWVALARRHYHDAEYGGGGEAARARALAAVGRALALDPQLPEAVSTAVILRTETGDLSGAYQDATRMLASRPDGAEAHYTVSYVLRYAGLLDEAAGECERALALDPKNTRWRSCAIVFMHLGRYDRARDFTSLDPASEWFRTLSTGLLMREDKPEEALRFVRPGTSNPVIEWMRACLEHRHRPDAARAASPAGLEEAQARTHDPENLYWIAGLFAYCGDREAALRVLRRTVQGGYCAYPAMDSDPLLAPVRGSPEFTAIREAAIACQKRFLAARSR